MSALWALPARELAARIARGEVSAREAVDAALARIDATHAALAAVVVRRDDEARREADEVDRRRAAGEALGPLAGVPVAVKESLDLAGTPSAVGLPSRRDLVAARDETHVARLRAAGAVVVGKTNVSQLLLYQEADNPLYGRTNNPWDPARAPGGSSGGQGAVVAAGGATLGLGTDIGGSVRSPAASCGVVGFLPTAGRLPDPGRLSEPIGQLAVQSQVGPIARDVDDAALALRVANGGPAPEDGHPRPLADHAGVRLAGLRVGVWLDDGVLAPGPAPRRAVARASAALERAGVTVVPFAGPDVADALGLYVALMSADGFRHARRVLGKDPRDRRIRLMELGHGGGVKMPVLRALLRLSGRKKTAAVLERFDDLSADRYFQLVEAQLDARAAWLAALDGAEGGPLDALVSPAQPVPAVLHGATAELGAMGGYYVLYNLLGWPAGVVPVTRVRRDEQAATPARGRDVMERVAAACEAGSAGLPVGVQVAARPWRDHVALALMRAIEADARASGEHPGLPILRS